MKSLLRIALSAAIAFLPIQAWAASGATTVSVFDSGSTPRTVNVYSSTGVVTGSLSWMNVICDFTTLTQCAAVKAASTAAGATDPALVVAISPNNTVAVTGTFWPYTLGQQVAGSSVPIVLTASQLATLTPPAAITNYANETGGNLAALVTGINIAKWDATALGVPTAYGTAPTTGNYIGVNAFVTNSNANGQATASNSSPVVLPAAQVTADVCSLNAKTNFTISTTSGTVQLVPPSGSTQVYICSLFTIGATASVQNLVGGTGASCTTGTPIAIAGSTTAANGMSFAANGGFTFGNGGGTILRTTTAGHGVCLIQSGTAQISGGGTYVQQ